MKVFHPQPTHLATADVRLVPLQEDDFERLYAIAADPLLWEQHPNPDRYKREAFLNYFEGAIASKGALMLVDAVSGEPMGCSRYYDYDPAGSSVIIGYTFVARKLWGTEANRTMKRLMLDYAFASVDRVLFHIGAHNIRSQMAIAKIGAVKIGEEEVAYYGEQPRQNFVYEIRKQDWQGAR